MFSMGKLEMEMFRGRFGCKTLALVLCMAASHATPAQAGNARRVLFVGNSFTAGMHSPVWHYQTGLVNDLNGMGVGGVPALFKLFTLEAHLNYSVSVEIVPGKTLKYHYTHEKRVLDQAWDSVVMQEYSALDPRDPGNPANYRTYANKLARMFVRKNAEVHVWLMASWSRPDMTYREASPWRGKSIQAMAIDLQRDGSRIAKSSPVIWGVVPVGLAFNRAIADGVADPDPYDGTDYGKVDLWAYDNHHASVYGYYLEALMDYAELTGKDPRKLGAKEKGAVDMGISPRQARSLQKVAYQQMHN